MHRVAIFLTVFLIGGFASIKLFDVLGETESEPDPSVKSERETQEAWIRYHSFKQVLQDTVTELTADRIRLKAAHIRVRDAAAQWNPKLFDHLAQWEQGHSDDERLVRNLVGHIEVVEKDLPTYPTRTRALRAEMEAYLLELGVP